MLQTIFVAYAFEGQLRLMGAAQKCLSVKGLAAGTNVALKSAISASSSADTGAHGASMAVDGNSNTFWARMKKENAHVKLALHVFVRALGQRLGSKRTRDAHCGSRRAAKVRISISFLGVPGQIFRSVGLQRWRKVDRSLRNRQQSTR